ncbi:hypothetical protein HJG60_010034 [Phyllostomus discolor]|uniref:Uncharacterized protein n=1 Tax=Phyllostomus discolor TaxID=89673 RepID=A0A834AYJ5_9CHIR|nr:hypothetical protein HJG60_010034 [Phyllostomus discolor]
MPRGIQPPPLPPPGNSTNQQLSSQGLLAGGMVMYAGNHCLHLCLPLHVSVPWLRPLPPCSLAAAKQCTLVLVRPVSPGEGQRVGGDGREGDYWLTPELDLGPPPLPGLGICVLLAFPERPAAQGHGPEIRCR